MYNPPLEEFFDSSLTVEAVYQPRGGSPRAIEVIFERPAVQVSAGGVRVQSAEARALCRDIDVADADNTATLTVGGDIFRVVEVKRDAGRIVELSLILEGVEPAEAPASSKREQIREALRNLLSGITVANGYLTDAGKNVSAWRPLDKEPYQLTELPAINIRDTSVNNIAELLAADKNEWIWELTVSLDVAARTMDECLDVISDIFAAMKTDEFLGGLVYNSAAETIENDISEEEMQLAAGTVQLKFYYRENRWGA